MDARYCDWHPSLLTRWEEERGKCVLNDTLGVSYLIVPKNASMSVRQLLLPWQYVWARTDEDRKRLNDSRVFTVIREPFSRFISSYGHMNLPCPENPIARSMPFIEVQDPVTRFIEFVHNVDGNLYELHLIQQVRFVEDSGLRIDDWVPFEDVDRCMKSFAKRWGVNSELPHINPGPLSSLKTELFNVLTQTPKLRAIVERMYADDFRLYKEKAGGTI